MRRSKRKHNNRTRRKHLDKLARARSARWTKAFRDKWYSESVSMKPYFSGIDPGGAAIRSRTITWKEYADICSHDPYIPPPELAAVRVHIQALINAEKKRIRQEYLTTRTGKGTQDG